MTSEANLKTIISNMDNMKKLTEGGYRGVNFMDMIKKKPVVATEHISNLTESFAKDGSGNGQWRMDINSLSNKNRKGDPLLSDKLLGKNLMMEEQFFSKGAEGKNLFKGISD